MSTKSPTNGKPAARLCHIMKWDHFDGYGFNLHAEKGVPGQYIGKVDPGSPAEATGLKQGDRIVEVNGVNITTETHKAVVQRIKAVPNETKLLVVDSEADKYYKENSIVIKGILPDILHLKTPDPFGQDNGKEDVSDNRSQVSESSAATGDIEGDHQKNSKNNRPSSAAASEKEGSIDSNQESDEPCMVPPAETGSGHSTLNKNEPNVTLNLNMSAKDYQNYLKAKKKYDPKKETMDTRKKYEIIQKL
ncbi:Na(+)/H(+) exchange regulatory cofactor NHE-RF1 [Hetaerina americana]|uniref:Na(+)/H(+) exchange regulatory cofactor NHE-RF1 n=1 Tax=Hetaerina americana TaxID=62018 RepID=UPI003A7F46A0